MYILVFIKKKKKKLLEISSRISCVCYCLPPNIIQWGKQANFGRSIMQYPVAFGIIVMVLLEHELKN